MSLADDFILAVLGGDVGFDATVFFFMRHFIFIFAFIFGLILIFNNFIFNVELNKYQVGCSVNPARSIEVTFVSRFADGLPGFALHTFYHVELKTA